MANRSNWVSLTSCVTSLTEATLLIACGLLKLMMFDGAVQRDALEKSAKVAVEAINNIRTVSGLRSGLLSDIDKKY